MAYLDTFAAEASYLRTRFFEEWGDRTLIAWPNVHFTPPADEPWVRFGVRHSGAERASCGPDPLVRHTAVVQIEIFAPLRIGDGELDELCDAAAAVFRHHHGREGLRFAAPMVLDIGPTDGRWYKRDVLCPFQRDAIHPTD